jgi:hypothetical protein
MTTDTPPPTLRVGRALTMQDELLQDLRQATPMPVVPTAVGQTPWRPPECPDSRDRQTPSLHLHLHVTVQRWSWPRVGLLPGGSGLSVGIGPVRVSLARGGH